MKEKSRSYSLKYLAAIAAYFACVSFAFAGTVVSIDKNGDAIIGGAKVQQVAGSTIFTRMVWGDAFVRITVKTIPTTKIFRATGELTSLAEVSEGDLISIKGTLESGSNTLTLIADTITDTTLQKKQAIFSGTVKGVDVSSGSFNLQTKKDGLITVMVGSTTGIVKGSRVIDISRLSVGDTIVQTSGDFNLSNKTLSAQGVTVYLNKQLYVPQNREGRFVATSATTLPATLNVVIGGENYTVFLQATSSVLNYKKEPTSLSRFVSGDKVRIFGTRREADSLMIDAETVRNTNL